MKTYGSIYYKEKLNSWIIEECEPHVAIKLKSVFSKLPKNKPAPFIFEHTLEVCSDLAWFMSRYPMKITHEDIKLLESGRQDHIRLVNEMEAILLPDYKPRELVLKEGRKARNYQLVANDTFTKCKRMLLADMMGLGKSLSAILCCMSNELPAAVVVQSHLTRQWKAAIEEFTNLRVHIIKSTRIYNLPSADIYIFSYHKIFGWIDIFAKSFFKMVVYDEIQELRRKESIKYDAAKILANSVISVLGLSGTPIYNYGNEMFNVMNIIKPGCLGNEEDFLREWTTNGKIITDPKALGAYLRNNYLMLRRTRTDVGRELPQINKIIHTVDYDHAAVEKANDIAKTLAIKATTGTFMEKGQASRELDAFARHQTGVAKASYVAEFVKILLENDEPVLLAGYHHDVYDEWKEQLAEYKPAFFTGNETASQKEKSKQAFMSGDTNLLIMSIVSGAGIDGLQQRCKTVVIGELDYSGNRMQQLIDRVNRDGQTEQVTVFFLVCDDGSDPVMMNIVGLKNSQSHGIIDPTLDVLETYSDESRAKMLAEYYLKKKHL